jgi:hypothetical protein
MGDGESGKVRGWGREVGTGTGDAPDHLGKLSRRTQGWSCSPHLDAGDHLLKRWRLVSPGSQQLGSPLKVLDVLTVHLQERGQFLDHIPNAGCGCPAQEHKE